MSTLRDLRHVASLVELKDYWSGTVTAAPSATQFTVDTLSYYPEGDFAGTHVYVRSGTGAGQERVILTHAAGGVFTVPAWTTLLVPGDSVVEFHRKYSAEAYNRALWLANQDSSARLLVPHYDNSIVVAEGQTEFDVPAEFVRLHQVDLDGVEVYFDDWRILKGRRKVRVSSALADQRLELWGGRKPRALVNDADEAETDDQFLIYRAVSMLLRGDAGGPATDPDASAQRSAFYEQLAQQRLTVLPQRIPPNSRRVE